MPDFDTKLPPQSRVPEPSLPAPTPGGSLPLPPPQGKPTDANLQALLLRAGFVVGSDGSIVVRDTGATTDVDAPKISGQYTGNTVDMRIEPPPVPASGLTVGLRQSALSCVTNVDRGFNDTFALKDSDGTTPCVGNSDAASAASLGLKLKNIDELNADQLLVAFLKLNLNDPANKTETLQALYEGMSNLRQLALTEANKLEEKAAKEMREAEQAADNAGFWGSLLTIVAAVVAAIATLVLTIFTFGAGTVLAILLAVALVTLVTQVTKAKLEYDASMKNLQAQETQNSADWQRFTAEKRQGDLQEHNELIAMLMESKNQMVDAVIRMLNSGFAASLKLQSAASSR